MSIPYITDSIRVNVGNIVADSDLIEHALYYSPRKIKVVGVRMAVSVAITAADTNYQVAKVMNGAVVVGQIATGPAAGGISFVKGVFQAAAAIPAAAEQAAGSTLKLAFAKVGTGMAMTGLIVQIDFYEYDA